MLIHSYSLIEHRWYLKTCTSYGQCIRIFLLENISNRVGQTLSTFYQDFQVSGLQACPTPSQQTAVLNAEWRRGCLLLLNSNLFHFKLGVWPYYVGLVDMRELVSWSGTRSKNLSRPISRRYGSSTDKRSPKQRAYLWPIQITIHVFH